MRKRHLIAAALVSGVLAACTTTQETSVTQKAMPTDTAPGQTSESFYGTLEPFASEAIYFLMTDRFVDGDQGNNQVNQGGEYPTYRRPIVAADGRQAFVGYMGGDFQGILNNAAYIKALGFSAIWLTPIVDNPDQAFAGGEPIKFGGAFKDGGKTGYHGYWSNNFYLEDEHWLSPELGFKELTQQLKQQHQIKTVLDVVANHGSPAFSMPVQQPKFGQLFDRDGNLVADHGNLEPESLDPSNPLHQFYNRKKDIMQLSDLNENNQAVLDYLADAYLYWIEQGADAFRIDTIKHMPHHFWKKFSDRIREKHPDYYMFAESYSFDPEFIGQHTQPENGGISVLDFPGKQAITKVFENPDSDFADLQAYLYLDGGPYANPYELTTFYDNHDMQRMAADDNGFIDAHNWLFTSRGIPVIYYGSEVGFMSGTKEHEGNRNYFGQVQIDGAPGHPIYQSLKRIANMRRQSIALQKGLQVNLDIAGDTATFYRVYEHQGEYQTALVMLNKGNSAATLKVAELLSPGLWRDLDDGSVRQVNEAQAIEQSVPAHGARVLVLNQKNQNPQLRMRLRQLMAVYSK